MITSSRAVLPPIEDLQHNLATSVAGGMINQGRMPKPPPDPGHGGLDQPYWASDESMRFGAGRWDYGYGSPTGPWPA